MSVPKLRVIDEESTEEMPSIHDDPFDDIFPEEAPFPKYQKAALFIGLTSGSFLSGVSVGYLCGAGKTTSMVDLMGQVGISVMIYSSFKYWFEKKE